MYDSDQSLVHSMQRQQLSTLMVLYYENVNGYPARLCYVLNNWYLLQQFINPNFEIWDDMVIYPTDHENTFI